MLIGLTGGYCAGKNAVATILEAWGWTAIDVDKLGHEAMERAQGAIIERFGSGILGAEGRIDRKALGALLFADPAALAAQEAIVHPIAIRLLDERIEASEAESAARGEESRVCINAALLYMAPQAARCAFIIEVRAPLLLRLRRSRRRDGLSSLAALRRIRKQAPLWRRRREAGRPVLVLGNSGELETLAKNLDRLLERAMRRHQMGYTLPPPLPIG